MSASRNEGVPDGIVSVPNKRYVTGQRNHAWSFNDPIRYETWNHQPSHWTQGPCPNCGYPTSTYGGGWTCHNDYCPSSAQNFACSAGPAPDWWGTNVNVFLDGTQWCATLDGFINLQESPAGFGDKPSKAVEALKQALTPPQREGGEGGWKKSLSDDLNKFLLLHRVIGISANEIMDLVNKHSPPPPVETGEKDQTKV